MTFIAVAIIELMSATFAGTIIDVPLFASSPNCLMYASAMRSCIASGPPGIFIASATRRMPSAVAVATDRIAAA